MQEIAAFQYLFSLPKAAIFAIINEFDRKVYISYSSNLKQRLGTIVEEICNDGSLMSRDTEKLELRILETSIDKNFVKYYIDDYRNNGYTIYNETDKIPVQYKFKIEIGIAEREFKVVAVNKRNDKITLGKFSDLETATKFMEFINSYNKTVNLIYSIYR